MAAVDNAISPPLNEAPPRGPIPHFDIQLEVLSAAYLSFFQERRRIEEYYVEALTRLHKKTLTIDSLLDERVELSSTRSVWREVRDNVEREAQTRTAFLQTLTVDVLNPLNNLKETQDRTRKRIKDDLKESYLAHTDFADTILPKLKRAYLKKCQEAESSLQPPTYLFQEPQPNTSASSRSNPTLPLKVAAVASQPSRPLERHPPSSTPSTRPRSPTGGTAFSDLATHGKKQLNQFITFLDKGAVKDPSRADGNLRTVRIKREADEADKEYRKAIHWLETLRLRRRKTMENGYKSLEMFVHESSTLLKTVLEKYSDNMMATSATQTQLASHVRSVVERINPDADTAAIASKISRAMAQDMPKPVLYYNFQVGECKDLIFGVSLVDYATARGLSEGEIPKIVRLCLEEIDQRGLKSEGIYRVSGRHAAVQELQHKIERNEEAFRFYSQDDVTAISSLLKQYLRELPEPVFRFPLPERLQHSAGTEEHRSNLFKVLRSKIRRLPMMHQATLKALVEHLARVVLNSAENKMDPKNLAIVFGTAIFGEDELPKAQDLLSVQSFKDTVMEDLITNAAILFDDRATNSSPVAPHSPPLPPAPLDEPVPAIVYGSAHTKFATLPPPDTLREQGDFSPPLPANPANSIHPSLRANSSSQPPAEDGPPPLRRKLNISSPPEGSRLTPAGGTKQSGAEASPVDSVTTGTSSSFPSPVESGQGAHPAPNPDS